MTRLFLDEMLFHVFVTGFTQALFGRFLLGDFALGFLVTICITVIVIIWKDMPLGPETLIHCYNFPLEIRAPTLLRSGGDHNLSIAPVVRVIVSNS